LKIEKRIKNKLASDIDLTEISVINQSHLHKGHDGYSPNSHFSVKVISDQFKGISRIERHKMVYNSLSELIESEIHALKIKALTPAELANLEKGKR
tara:strand:+ start:257 stop:544 length:288 start_codon:yes stop_codon:yes gene_type:complete